jgi:hypothetical protein
MIGDT